MAIPQNDVDAPASFEVGTEVTVRLGFCCPDIRVGWITALSDKPTQAVLTIGADEWALEPAAGTEANDIPGIRSKVWRVR